MTLDNLDILNGSDGGSENKTLLDFEISETPEAVTDTVDTAATAEPVKASSEEITVDTVQTEETASAPDIFDLAQKEANSYVETPASIRPTYLPRFTEVSDTYRMQNDPRPRPKSDVPVVKVTENEADGAELDPTAENVEEKVVEKVIVTSSHVHNSEPIDETLKVLKFSTPTYDDEPENNATEEPVSEPAEEQPAADAPVQELNVDELIAELPFDERPISEIENSTIPDPDATYRVVEFTPHVPTSAEDPLGASDSDKKDKFASHAEFNSPIQRDAIKDRFLDTLMAIRVRLVGSLLLLIAMTAIDCLTYLGHDVLGALGFGSVAYARAVLDMQFSICIFLFTLPEILKAFKLLVKGKCTPEIINVVSLAVIILNDLAIVASGAVDYLTFGVLYGLQCFVTVIASYNKAQSDFASFRLVSRNVAKNVLDKRLTRELQRENLALDGAVDEYNSQTARMFRTVFVSSFFKRSARSCENFLNTAMMIGVSAGIALVTGAVSFFLDGNSIVSGAQSLTMVFMLAYPVFSILNHKLPYKHVCQRAGEEESAFVGETSIYEANDIDVLTYEDTEIFGIEDVSIRKVHLYGKAYNTPKAMKHMYGLFSVVGGPLDFVFSSALDRKCSPAEDIVIEDNGVSGTMDGHKICAGTEEYMISHGISIPEDDYRTNTSSSDSTKIMYGAEDGEVYVKFFIRYSFSEEFTMLLPYLKEKKIVPLVYTRDPNITVELLRVLTLGEDVIRVMKKYVPRTTEEKTYRRIDSGIVTHGNKDNAINMVLLSKKYAVFQSSLAATELISMIVGAVLAVVLAIGNMFNLPATFLALWQIVWCAVLYVRSKLTFQNRHDREDIAQE